MTSVECYCENPKDCETKYGLRNFRVDFDRIERGEIKHGINTHIVHYTVWDKNRAWDKK